VVAALLWDAVVSLLEVLGVLDCGAALDAISLLLGVDGAAAVGAVAVAAELLSGVELDGAAAAVEVPAFAAELLVLGLVALILPELTSVPLAVFPAVPEVAGPGLALAMASLLEACVLLVGDVELAGVWLLTGGVVVPAALVFPSVEGEVAVPVAGVLVAAAAAVPALPAAAADSFAAEPVLALGLLDPDLLHESEIMLTEVTLSMSCAVPVVDPLVPLDAAPGADVPLPTVPETAT